MYILYVAYPLSVPFHSIFFLLPSTTLRGRSAPEPGGTFLSPLSASTNTPNLTPIRSFNSTERTYGRSRGPQDTVERGETSSRRGDEHMLDHVKLLSKSLAVFEFQLSRLPLMGDTTTVTVPDIFRHARSMVRSAEWISDMLRGCADRTLERQVGAEIE